jgi:23S rRNA pseudouridine1911/1915/1917 synthase
MPYPRRFLPDRTTRHEFIGKREDSIRIDVFLTGRLPTLSRALIQRFIKEGRAKVNGRVARPSSKVCKNDLVEIEVPHIVRPKMVPREMPLDILFEDEHFIAIHKPAGLVMHPSTGHWEDTLVNAVVAHLKIPIEATDIVRPGIVHRLDKDTSGVIVMGKTHTGLDGLAKQFRERTIEKEYRAIVHGELARDEGEILLPIGRNRADSKKMGVARAGTGKEAVSRYRVLERLPGFTFVSVVPETGRMHQIRVHLANIGHPCVGDPLYAADRPSVEGMSRQALHAHRLVLRHPATGAPMTLTAPLAGDMAALLERLRGGANKRVDPFC